MRHEARIPGEVGQVQSNLDYRPKLIVAETVPEIIQPELPVSLRKPRIKDQLERSNEVALPDLVFADSDDAVARLNVELSEIGEIDDPRAIRDMAPDCTFETILHGARRYSASGT